MTGRKGEGGEVLERVLGGGDVVLEPQRLAHIFARVVSCHENTVRDRQLFSDGIIRHGNNTPQSLTCWITHFNKYICGK